MSENDIVREFLLGFVKIHVLHHAVEGEVYGQALMDELARHGYKIGPSTIYPLLRDMEKSGYLQRSDRVVAGKVRKYYRATQQGSAALVSVQDKIRELVSEVLPPGK